VIQTGGKLQLDIISCISYGKNDIWFLGKTRALPIWFRILPNAVL